MINLLRIILLLSDIHLTETLDDAKNALMHWLGERIEEWEEETNEDYDEICLEINIKDLDLIDSVEYEYISLDIIEPSRILNIFEI